MKIVFFLIGSRGDMQPPLLMAERLTRAGHDIVVAAPENHRGLVESTGVKFEKAGADTDAMAAEHENGIRGALRLWQTVKKEFGDQCEIVERLSEGADLLVGGLHTFAAPSIAERLGIPFAWALASPVGLPSAEVPCVLLNAPQLPAWMTSWKVFAASCRLRIGLIGMVNAYRRSRGMRHLTRLSEMVRCEAVVLATDPLITGAPSDWPYETHTTGFCFLRPPSGHALPTEVERFLAAGDPPVFFGLPGGSDPDAATKRIVDAVGRIGRRAVISGVKGLGGVPLPPSCIKVDTVSYGALFPRMSAAVHHGGVGTAAEALRARLPQIAAPSIFDQPFWAERFRRAGVAAPSIGLDVPADELASRIRMAIDDTSLRARIAKVADEITSRDGGEAGAKVLERVAGEAARGRLRSS